MKAGALPVAIKQIAFRPARVLALGGVAIAADQQRQILADLGFSVSGTGDSWQVSAPSWRADIEGEADLVE